MVIPDMELDVCNQCCPVPLIRLALATAALIPNQRIRVRGDDPIFEQSVHDFCLVQNLQIVEQIIDGKIVSFLLQR